MKITIIQMNSLNDVQGNLTEAERLIRKAHQENPSELYVLPEYAHLYGADPKQIKEVAEQVPTGPICCFFSSLAKELNVGIHCGTINEPSRRRTVFNNSVIFGPDGNLLAQYRKMHLIDATMADGRRVKEKLFFDPGNTLSLFRWNGITFGCTTCHDICYPEIFRALRRNGADVILFVTALQWEEGDAHFDYVLRTRAFESQCYIAASCQCGPVADGRGRSYGHSQIVDPSGKVLEKLGEKPGYISFEVDIKEIGEVRNRMEFIRTADGVGLDRTGQFERKVVTDVSIERPDDLGIPSS